MKTVPYSHGVFSSQICGKIFLASKMISKYNWIRIVIKIWVAFSKIQILKIFQSCSRALELLRCKSKRKTFVIPELLTQMYKIFVDLALSLMGLFLNCIFIEAFLLNWPNFGTNTLKWGCFSVLFLASFFIKFVWILQHHHQCRGYFNQYIFCFCLIFSKQKYYLKIVFKIFYIL